MRNKMLIPALLSVVLPALSACDAVTSGPLALRASAPQPAPARRMSLMGERMGSTGDTSSGGDTSTGGEEPPGETEAGTSTGGGMPIEDTDGASSTSTGSESSSGTTGEGTSSGTTSEPVDCPWWGCEVPAAWVAQPLDVFADCGHPTDQPELGEAKCAAHVAAMGLEGIPHDCIRASSFEVFDTEIIGWGKNAVDLPPPGHWYQPAFCSPRCERISNNNSMDDPCRALGDAMDMPWWLSCVSGTPDPAVTGTCTDFNGWFPAVTYPDPLGPPTYEPIRMFW